MNKGFDSTLRASINCTNNNCTPSINIQELQKQMDTNGLEFAICEDTLFQVLKCINLGCTGKIVIRCNINKPFLDMRGLLLVPERNSFLNSYEQQWILQNKDLWHDYLKFQIIPAWDDSCISTQEFLGCFSSNSSNPVYSEVPFCLSEQNFQTRIISSQPDQLRRLLPDKTFFRNILICMSPLKIREITTPGAIFADGLAPKDLLERRIAWKTLLEETEGQTFEDAIYKKLGMTGIKLPNSDEINNLVERELFYKAVPSREQLWEMIYSIDFSPNFDNLLKKIYKSILYCVCTELAFSEQRNELLNWPNEVEKGKALFIDAPMGLGKTYSITKALASNPDLSAVIFMPTNRLCQEITENLKLRIAAYKNIIGLWGLHDQRELILDDDGNPMFDDDGLHLDRFKRSFLETEVYFADGINHQECPNADEIISQYKKNWIKKRLVCNKCEKSSTCRFLHHYEKASRARIIVTTHHQYDHFYHSNELHYWNNDNEQKPRNFFIIDEDLMFSQLYQPVNLGYEELRAFIGTITNVLQEHDEVSHLRNDIYRLFSLIDMCDHTSIIRPVEPEFAFPEGFIKKWENSLPGQPFIIPKYIKWSEIVGNHLKVIEHAVRFGAVVEKWGKRFKIHLPNPRSYDLSKAPPHVFFDGTMLNEKFLNNKLSGVEFKKWRVDISCPWKVRVYQNTNSDLPERWIGRDKPKVQQFLKSIVNNTPIDKKIFLITTNAITKSYLQEFIDSEFQDRYFVSGYYGNIRGINDAQECNLGIMLGSFMPSDSIEIAMALELIDSDNLDKDITITINNLWTWNDTNGVRKYKKDFAIIGQMAKAYRHSEHRQALARTRYLFHDVDFYIISKDLVSDYDPFLPNIVDTHYREDLFRPRPKRPEATLKFDEIADKVLEWLSTHETVNATQLHKQYGIRRQTIGEKLKEMRDRGILVLENGKKTTYRLPLPQLY